MPSSLSAKEKKTCNSTVILLIHRLDIRRASLLRYPNASHGIVMTSRNSKQFLQSHRDRASGFMATREIQQLTHIPISFFSGSMSSFNLHLLDGTWHKSFRVEILVHITIGFFSHHDVAMATCPYKGIETRWTKFLGTSLNEVKKFEVSRVDFQKTITTTHCLFANFLPLAKGLLWTCSFYLNCLKRKPGGFVSMELIYLPE